MNGVVISHQQKTNNKRTLQNAKITPIAAMNNPKNPHNGHVTIHHERLGAKLKTFAESIMKNAIQQKILLLINGTLNVTFC